MIRQSTAELYRRHIEETSLRDLTGATALFVVVAVVLLLLDRQQAIVNVTMLVDKEADAKGDLVSR